MTQKSELDTSVRSNRTRRQRALLALVVAFVATFVCFLASTLYTTTRLADITGHSRAVSRNALPSIVHLASMRSELRRVERALDAAVDRDADVVGAPPLGDALARVEGHAAAYDALMVAPGEVDLWTRARSALARSEEGLRRAAAHIASGEMTDAAFLMHHDVKSAVDATDAAMGELIELNVAFAERAALEVEASRARVTRLALGLDVVSVVVSLLTALLGLVVARGYARLLEERANELDLFAARVAHDIRGPLGPALMTLQHFSDEGDDEARRWARRGARSLERVATIVGDLLAFARCGAEPDATARASLREALDGAVSEVEPLAAERRVEIRAEPAEDVMVSCAPGVLASILSNLVRNAVNYMGDSERRSVVLRSTPLGRRVVIEVEDSGPGIPADMHRRVFEPYFRGSRGGPQGGLGLGLATVKRLAEAHGGEVSLRSTKGQGTTFSVCMPRAA